MDKIIALGIDLNLDASTKDAQEYLKLQKQIQETIIEIKNQNKLLSKDLKDVTNNSELDLAVRQKIRKETKEQLAENQIELKKLQKEQRTLNKSVEAGNDAYKKSTIRLGEVKKEIKALLVAGKPVPQALEDEFKDLNNTVRDAEESVGEFFRNVGNYPDSFNGLGEAFGDVFGEFSGGIGGLNSFGDVFENLTGKFTKGNVVLAATIGAVVELGSFIATTTLEFERLRQQVTQSTNAVGGEVDLITVRAKSLEDVFGLEFNENVKAANALAEQFGISYDEAFDLVEQGIVSGANANGDFLDTLTEYSSFFADAGESGEDFIAIITQQVKSGVFSDKGVDAFKEAAISLRELPDSAKEALNGIGFTSDEIKKLIDEEGLGGAVRAVSNRLSELPADSQEVGTAIADIFKGAGEDAGDFIFELGKIEGGLIDITNSTDAYTQRQLRQLDAQKALNEELNLLSRQFEGVGTFFQTLGTEISGFFLEKLNDVIFAIRGTVNTLQQLASFDFSSEVDFSGNQLRAEEAAAKEQEVLEKRLAAKQKAIEQENQINKNDTEQRKKEAKRSEARLKENEKELSSIDSLNKKQKELQSQIQELILTGGDYSKEQEEYIEVTNRITNATSELNKVLNETDFTQNASIKELESLIKNQEGLLGEAFTKEDINKFLSNIDELNAQLDAKLEQRRSAFNEILGVGDEVATIGSLSDDASLTGGEDIVAALDLENRLTIDAEQRKQDQLEEIQKSAADNRERAEDIRRENELEKRKAFLEEIQRIEDEKNDAIIQGTESLGVVIGEFLSGQQTSFKDFLKQILLTGLDALEKIVLLQVAELTARQIATKGFAGIATTALLTGLIRGAFSGIGALIQSFDQGGKVLDYPEINGRVNVAPNAPRLQNGDNILGYLHRDEAVITKDHQQQLNDLLGYNAMKAIGVKGFENESMFLTNSIPTPRTLTFTRREGRVERIDQPKESIDYDKLGQSVSDAINENPIQIELVELKTKMGKIEKLLNRKRSAV